MTLRLYDDPKSTNAIKVRFLLAELGLDYERVDTPIGSMDRAVHPFGLIPALVDGDLTVTESNTALRYLAERAGRDDLRGADPVARARVDMALDSLSLEVRPALWAVEEVVVYGLEAPDAAERTRALEDVLAAFDRLLDADGPYALGAFTIADCALAGRALHLPRLGLDPAVAPRTFRAVAAAQERPAFAAAR